MKSMSALCDVCNSEVKDSEGERVLPDMFEKLLDNGFGIDPYNIKMLTNAGMPEEIAVKELKKQYKTSKSDWLLCPKCVAEAQRIMKTHKELWIDEDHISVTRTAEEVGLGFEILGAPVVLTRKVWENYIKWIEIDNDKQTYQEQDARLWDVLFTAGGTLELKINQFFGYSQHEYSIYCIPRDGVSKEATKMARN